MNISGVSAAVNLYASAPRQGQSAQASAFAASTSLQGGQTLSPDEQNQVEKLKARDRQVRQHEQAHMAAGAGMITSGASFTYQRGPDGVNYAVGGEVGISTSPGRTPEETIQRARQIRSAALAPADPSGQDRAVAAKAAQMAQEAEQQKSEQSRQQTSVDESGQAAMLRRAYAVDPFAPVPAHSTYA